MEIRDSHRMGARELAIRCRLAELDLELHRTQLRVNHLEAQMEDARLARMLGEEAAETPAELAPALEASRGSLERQREFIRGVKKQHMQAAARCAVARVQEAQADREREEQERGGQA
jgi:hypothetical protein